MKNVYKVPVKEYEFGWGSKIDDFMLCESLKNATEFIESFNSKNTENVAPVWYMIACDDIEQTQIKDSDFLKLQQTKTKRIWQSMLR